MTQEEKELLLKDLCARSYYWPEVTPKYGVTAYIYGIENTNDGLFRIQEIEDVHDYSIVESVDEFKVYLRPMSSMTKKEKREVSKFGVCEDGAFHNDFYDVGIYMEEAFTAISWLLERHFDINNLIQKGLALEAPKGMYKTE